ncbi:acid protease [Coniophora puteana RWD-64-598 SS2]|uniref:Acid protease n=1 Tax=Coniophora puteana (strain RWD-64-598) TaxID=741705 RepID=A0A5M3MRD3_CONPW|nr:acid protease [Coniophora puteana RWD-64-598 SS2]EIW81636.1 acid protease [Coniophora puteana RWD-64-598 SS2]
MDMVPTSYFGVAYTLPIQIGSSQQSLSLQVDTGSSDMWIASSSCSSSSCKQTSGNLYNPSSSTNTNKSFSINYLSGEASGPIVWDKVSLGGYEILTQALAAVNNVNNEPLASNFDGILGMALPLNSIIAQDLPPTESNQPDGASFAANLLSMTPVSSAPSQPFFSLSLARPGSDNIQSLFSIGRHPSSIISSPSELQWSNLISENVGILHWKTMVAAITVYVNGQEMPIALGTSVTGVGYPTALLDSGVPLIMTTSAIANGIYGALGINPSNDNTYYVPCATPLNMTITLDGQPAFPLHPLDLTNEPQGQSNAQNCIGLIQANDELLTASSSVGDMVLGVPFLRSVYTVMAYEHPKSDGTFNTSVSTGINPILGMKGLTNSTQAMQEFYNVRVLNQPLSGGGGSPQSSSGGGKKFSTGLAVLVGLLSFFGLCLALFGARFLMMRRKMRQQAALAALGTKGDPDGDANGGFTGYQLARRHSHSPSRSSYDANDSTLRPSTYNSDKGSKFAAGEFGFRNSKHSGGDGSNTSLPTLSPNDPWRGSVHVRDSIFGWQEADDDDRDATLVQHSSASRNYHQHQRTLSPLGSAPLSPPLNFGRHSSTLPPMPMPLSPTTPRRPSHARTVSELSSGTPPGTAAPLLGRGHSRGISAAPAGEHGERERSSMAGVGTASRSSRIDPDLDRHRRNNSSLSGVDES